MALLTLLFVALAIYFAGWPRDFVAAALCVTLASVADLARRVGNLQQEVSLLKVRLQELRSTNPFRGL